MMKSLRVVAAVSLFALAACVPDADESTVAEGPQVQTVERKCGPYHLVQAFLAREYGETVAGAGVGLVVPEDRASVVQLFLNRETGTGSLVATNSEGVACLVASLQDWSLVAGALPGTDT